MSRATIGTKHFLAATLSLVGGLLMPGQVLAAMDMPGDSGNNQAGVFTPPPETTPSNWAGERPTEEPKLQTPTVTTVTSSSAATSDKSSKAAETDRQSKHKLPSAVEMLKRFQKGGNPNELFSTDDAELPVKPADKDASKNLSPSLVHNFGPKGVLIPGAKGSASTDADKADAATEDVVVNKEPAVAPESAEVVTAVRTAYGELGKGKVEEALSTMAAAVRKEPRSMLARRASAFIMLYSGNAKEAVDQLFVLAGLPNYQPQSFDRCTLGDAYLLLGRPDNALIAFEDALKINGENIQAKSGELRSMALVGRVDEALTDCVEAYKKAKQVAVQRYYRQLYVSLAEARNQGIPAAIGDGQPVGEHEFHNQ